MKDFGSHRRSRRCLARACYTTDNLSKDLGEGNRSRPDAEL